MQVDKHNFANCYNQIWECINQSSFISFDCEFTGLTTYPWEIESAHPDYHEFYERIKETSFNFALLQVGLTFFIWNEKQSVYESRPFNFYINPEGQSKDRDDWINVIGCQVESLKFLASQGMNFKKAFQDGIPISRLKAKSKEVEDAKDNLNKMMKVKNHGSVFNKADHQFMGAIEGILRKSEQAERIDFKTKMVLDFFREKYHNQNDVYLNFDRPKKKEEYNTYEYVVKLIDRNKDKKEKKEKKAKTQVEQQKKEEAYEKEIKEEKIEIKEEKKEDKKQENAEKNEQDSYTKAKSKIQNNFEAVWKDEKYDQSFIFVQKKNIEDPKIIKTQLDIIIQKAEMKFHNLIHEIIKRRVPIVGYYCQLDLGLIYHNFIDALPPRYEDFSIALNNYFPVIIDLKMLIDRSLESRLQNAKIKWNLSGLYQACKSGKHLHCPVNLQSKGGYEKEERHEAGWDSYMTGVAFAALASNLQNSYLFNFNSVVWKGIPQVLYSKHTGAVSLTYPYTPFNYENKIVMIFKPVAEIGSFQTVQKILANYGSYRITEYLGQTYFYFENNAIDVKAIQDIYPALGFKNYRDRMMLFARNRDIYK